MDTDTQVTHTCEREDERESRAEHWQGKEGAHISHLLWGLGATSLRRMVPSLHMNISTLHTTHRVAFRNTGQCTD